MSYILTLAASEKQKPSLTFNPGFVFRSVLDREQSSFFLRSSTHEWKSSVLEDKDWDRAHSSIFKATQETAQSACVYVSIVFVRVCAI